MGFHKHRSVLLRFELEPGNPGKEGKTGEICV